jgi:hypothetical protein
MGLLTPLGTGLASALLAGLAAGGPWAGWVTGAVGLAFLLSAAGLWAALREPPGLSRRDEPVSPPAGA